MSTPGERVRAEREARQWSQAELARRSGVSEWTLVQVEADRGNPTLGTMAKLAAALEVGLGDLFIEGPGLLRVTFRLSPGEDLGPAASLESRLLAALASASGVAATRMAIGPWLEPIEGPTVVTGASSKVVVRVTASALPSLVTVTGARLSVGVDLSAPVVQPVGPAEMLRVLVRAPCPTHAQTKIRREATAAGCCPSVRITGRRVLESGTGWLALVMGAPAAASTLLQCLRVPGPEGLFVPA